MKKKMKYIYGGLFIIIVFTLIFSINSSNNKIPEVKTSQNNAGKISANTQMPNDELHSKLNPEKQSPNKDNVSKNFIHDMNVLKEQIAKTPEDTSIIKKYAILLSASHKQSEAVKFYKRILKIDPRRKDVLLDLTFAYFNLKDLSNAEFYTKQLIEYYPNNLPGQYNLGAIYATQGKKKEAAKIWKKIIAKSPDSYEAKLSKSSLARLNK